MKKKESKHLKQFLKGLSKNSIVIVALATIIAFAMFIALEIYVKNGGITKTPKELIAVEEGDYFTDVTYKLYELDQREEGLNDYSVYFIGGSSMREIVISEEEMKNSIDEKYNINSSVHMLSISKMSTMDYINVIDNLPDENGLVVIGLNNSKMNIEPEFKRIFIKSDIYMDYLNNDEYIQSIKQEKTSKYQIVGTVYAKKYIDRLFNSIYRYKDLNKIKIPIDIKYHWYDNRDNPKIFDQARQELENQNKYSKEDVAFYNKILKHMIEICHDKGLDVVLLHLPYNEDILGESIYKKDSRFTSFRAATTSIADLKSVDELDFIYSIGFSKEDYYDINHINVDSARKEYESAFIKKIGKFLEKLN